VGKDNVYFYDAGILIVIINMSQYNYITFSQNFILLMSISNVIDLKVVAYLNDLELN
jgi:hypothetical protein